MSIEATTLLFDSSLIHQSFAPKASLFNPLFLLFLSLLWVLNLFLLTTLPLLAPLQARSIHQCHLSPYLR